MIETDTESPNTYSHSPSRIILGENKCMTLKGAEETMSTDVYMWLTMAKQKVLKLITCLIGVTPSSKVQTVI